MILGRVFINAAHQESDCSTELLQRTRARTCVRDAAGLPGWRGSIWMETSSSAGAKESHRLKNATSLKTKPRAAAREVVADLEALAAEYAALTDEQLTIASSTHQRRELSICDHDGARSLVATRIPMAL
ncbi:MAG: hypothetical protein CM1200mP36_08560 [Gammaproteobacteria bacterium]|nr:MAG: hypothetical protein CM1200mP36_08560 [Gammaproteobacteria bacterium]